MEARTAQPSKKGGTYFQVTRVMKKEITLKIRANKGNTGDMCA